MGGAAVEMRSGIGAAAAARPISAGVASSPAANVRRRMLSPLPGW